METLCGSAAASWLASFAKETVLVGMYTASTNLVSAPRALGVSETTGIKNNAGTFRNELSNSDARTAQSLQLTSTRSCGRRPCWNGQTEQGSEGRNQGSGRNRSGCRARTNFRITRTERGGEVDDSRNPDHARPPYERFRVD